MAFKYDRKKVWYRWELDYFSRILNKMYARRKDNGYPVYSSKEEAFWALNEIYESVWGKPRYANYESFKSSLTQRK